MELKNDIIFWREYEITWSFEGTKSLSGSLFRLKLPRSHIVAIKSAVYTLRNVYAKLYEKRKP